MSSAVRMDGKAASVPLLWARDARERGRTDRVKDPHLLESEWDSWPCNFPVNCKRCQIEFKIKSELSLEASEDMSVGSWGPGSHPHPCPWWGGDETTASQTFVSETLHCYRTGTRSKPFHGWFGIASNRGWGREGAAASTRTQAPGTPRDPHPRADR